jgi:hypothetical protein
MKRVVFGAMLFAATLALGGSAAADCSTIIATTPTGSSFPCTVCVEGGRPISAICTPPLIGK